MAAELDGPRLEPRSGPARARVVFLHGYGADGNDLIELGRSWQGPASAGRVRLAARAAAMRGSPHGEAMVRAHIPRSRRTLDRLQRGCTRPRAFSRWRTQTKSLPASALALVGFSQGTMMALHVGLRRATVPFAIVGYSGLLVVRPDANAEKFAAEIKSRPPVLLVHGEQDDLIPAQALFQAASGLSSLGIPVEWHLSRGVGHGIDQEGLRHGGEFLARRLAAAR
jgi:phospholipase/carboxylesterase